EILYTPEDYRFTVNGGCIYAICMCCPKDGRFLIRSFAESANQNLPEFHGILRAVTLLGYAGQAAWHVDREGLHIAAPGFESDFPVVFRLEVD
ncbi:MAG: alpha-L-fucosidase C-terminal domain-containing protein, partial [Roseburia hominis]